ncbi:MAG: helix-turn-helix transcriptional regulator, partial [Bacteroidota bacterium]
MTFEEFGQDLRAQRVARNVSLTEISAETRINQRFLEAIERGQFFMLPQAYIRAFLREYASAVGLPLEQVLQQYADIGERPSSPSPPKGEAPTRTVTTSERPATPSPSMTLPPALRPYVFGAIILGAGLLAFLLLQSGGGESPPTTTSGEIPFDRVIRETEAALPADSIPRFSVTPAPMPVLTQDSLTLEMTTTDSVWINIVID